jgi:hypothetical protein
LYLSKCKVEQQLKKKKTAQFMFFKLFVLPNDIKHLGLTVVITGASIARLCQHVTLV